MARLAVLSNGDQSQQEDKLRRTGLDRLIRTVFTSGSLGVAKPDPAVFAEACRRLGTAPADTVYIGDRLDLDASPAAAAGLRAVWLRRDGARRPGRDEPGTDEPGTDEPGAGTAGVEIIGTLAALPPLLGTATGNRACRPVMPSPAPPPYGTRPPG